MEIESGEMSVRRRRRRRILALSAAGTGILGLLVLIAAVFMEDPGGADGDASVLPSRPGEHGAELRGRGVSSLEQFLEIQVLALDALSEEPVQGARVSVSLPGAIEPIVVDTTSHIGVASFLVPESTSSTVSVLCEAAGYETTSSRAELSRKEGAFLVLRLAGGGAIEGRVLSATGRPLAGASVTLSPAYRVTSAKPVFRILSTEEDGSFRAQGLRTGVGYRVTTTCQGHQPSQLPSVRAASPPTAIEFRLAAEQVELLELRGDGLARWGGELHARIVEPQTGRPTSALVRTEGADVAHVRVPTPAGRARLKVEIVGPLGLIVGEGLWTAEMPRPLTLQLELKEGRLRLNVGTSSFPAGPVRWSHGGNSGLAHPDEAPELRYLLPSSAQGALVDLRWGPFLSRGVSLPRDEVARFDVPRAGWLELRSRSVVENLEIRVPGNAEAQPVARGECGPTWEIQLEPGPYVLHVSGVALPGLILVPEGERVVVLLEDLLRESSVVITVSTEMEGGSVDTAPGSGTAEVAVLVRDGFKMRRAALAHCPPGQPIEITGLASGEYLLRGVHPNGARSEAKIQLAPGERQTVHLPPWNSTPNYTVRILGQGGEPMAGALVKIETLPKGATSGKVTNLDSDGRAAFMGLPGQQVAVTLQERVWVRTLQPHPLVLTIRVDGGPLRVDVRDLQIEGSLRFAVAMVHGVQTDVLMGRLLEPGVFAFDHVPDGELAVLLKGAEDGCTVLSIEAESRASVLRPSKVDTTIVSCRISPTPVASVPEALPQQWCLELLTKDGSPLGDFPMAGFVLGDSRGLARRFEIQGVGEITVRALGLSGTGRVTWTSAPQVMSFSGSGYELVLHPRESQE